MKALFVSFVVLFMVAGCTTAPIDPTPRQQAIANAVEDVLSVGLVPVLSKNPAYLPLARGMAGVVATFGGTTLTEADVTALLAKTSVAPEDQRVIVGLVMAAWDTYARRYAEQVGKSVRPDVKVFAGAVSRGILNAVAAVPVGAG